MKMPEVKITRATKQKIGLGFLACLVGLTILLLLVSQVALWFKYNTIVFPDKYVVVKFNFPRVEKVEPVYIYPVAKADPKYPEEVKTDIEKYICDKFGVFECKTAIAIAKAESGVREDAININSNGTIDYGIFQINSIHYKKDGCSLKEITDAYKNVDCAYQIWVSNGKSWNPWVAFTNNSYMAKL